MPIIIRTALLFCLALLPFTPMAEVATARSTADASAAQELLRSYRRLLPLEGGSNFRDLGGYPTMEGKTVKRGLLFRSGAMAGLTDADMAYLSQFGFQTVVDLRSSEELELYPNRWVATDKGIHYAYHEYSMLELMKQAAQSGRTTDSGDYSGMYRYMADMLKPQLSLYFEALLSEEVPLVVNCSAGQDRTGITSALLLTVLGVDRELIMEDYLLSTDFRRPAVEKGDVNLVEAAETNAFAAMMLKYAEGQDESRPNPLVTPDGTPFLQFALASIDSRYGDVASYLEKEIGVTQAEQARLRELYLD